MHTLFYGGVHGRVLEAIEYISPGEVFIQARNFALTFYATGQLPYEIVTVPNGRVM